MTANPGVPSPPPPPARRVAVRDDLALNIVETGPGSGDAVVLVHGLASNARLWDGVALALGATGRRVVSVDLRGHGLSDRPDSGYDMATVAEDVARLIDALGLQRPVVAGQSWGGNVVVELAWAYPALASALVCVDGGTIHLQDRFADFDACWAALAPPQFDGTTRADVERYLRANHPDWPESGIRGALACFEVGPDETVRPWLTRARHRAVLEGLWSHAPRARFADIAVPVLFLPADSGDEPPTAAKRAAIDEALSLLAQGDVQWFAPADHDVHAQHPERVAAAIAAFAPADPDTRTSR